MQLLVGNLKADPPGVAEGVARGEFSDDLPHQPLDDG